MVTDKALDHTFAALADGTRRGILARLERGPASVGELAEPFAISRPAISKHLRVLERAGLVRRTKRGRESRCTLDPDALRQAASWVARYERYWNGQLAALADYFDAGQRPAPKRTEEETDAQADAQAED